MHRTVTVRALAAIAAALLTSGALAACGGGDGGSSSSASTPAPATTPAATATTPATTPAGGGATASAGKAVFAANCTTCHRLKDAGSTGTTGPNLDDLKPDAETVKNQVTNGGGGMPPFKDQLSETQIQAVAVYVSSVAGS